MKFILVVNPESGTKQSSKILDLIQPIFHVKGADLLIIPTEFSGHAEKIAKTVNFSGYDGFLALGGDGTINEVVNGMISRPAGDRIPIGIIPGGSGNSFLRDVQIRDPITAAESITSRNTRFIDTARIEMGNLIRHSINLIGWGLVTDVGKRAEQLRWLGPKRYTISSIIEIILKKERKAHLVIDGQPIDGVFTFVVACNSIHVGKGMKMAPKAKLDDGLIDIVVVKGGLTRGRLLSVLPKLFDGSHIHEPEVEYYQASQFSLHPESIDDLNIDGEMMGNTPINVTMIQKSIEIFG